MTRLAPKREILVNVGKKGSRSNSSPAAPTRKSVCFEGSVVVVAIEFAVSRAGADVCFLPESALLVKRKKKLSGVPCGWQLYCAAGDVFVNASTQVAVVCRRPPLSFCRPSQISRVVRVVVLVPEVVVVDSD